MKFLSKIILGIGLTVVLALILFVGSANGAWFFNQFTRQPDYYLGNTEGEPDVASGTIDLLSSGQICLAGDCQTSWPGGAGSGDVTSVGDCLTGACYDGTSDGGTYAKFYDADGIGTLGISDLSGAQTWSLPDRTGELMLMSDFYDTELASTTLAVDGTWSFNGLTTLDNATGTALTLDELWGGSGLLSIGDNASGTDISVSDNFWGNLIGNVVGNLTGNADTTTALAANGNNCSAGQSPLGVDTVGAAESCFDVWTEAENTAANYLQSSDWDDKFDTEIASTTIDITGTWTFSGLTTMGNASSTALTGTELYSTDLFTTNAILSGLASVAGDISTDTELYTPQLCLNGDCQSSWPAGGTPAGNDTEIQYNNSGSFGAEATFLYDDATNLMTVENASTTQLSGDELWGTTGNFTSLYSTDETITGVASNTGTSGFSTNEIWGTSGEFSTSLMCPVGAAITPTTAGQIAIDTTDDQLKYYGGAERVLPYTYEKCFAIETPVAADDNVPIWFPLDAITITSQYCMVQGGTSAEITISDGTNAMEAVVCDADGQADDGSLTNNTFTANERMEFDTGTVTGSVTWVTFCNRYTITAQ